MRFAARFAVAFVVAGTLMQVPATAAPSIRDGVLESFDGTPIAYTLFLPPGASASRPAPVVFNTHGWGGTRARSSGGFVGTLLERGYAVLTWDARGFGDSGGEANVDSQEFEVRDVRKLIDLAASTKEILRDAPGDPRMGMIGGSYAGGIQLMTASADRRVDAIVPEIAWHDLVQSLRPGGVFKLGWGSLLYGAGTATSTLEGLDSSAGPQHGGLALQIHRGFAESVALNAWSAETEAWFDARSPKRYLGGATASGVGRIPGLRAPTLIIQGLSDNLFPLNEGVANYRMIRSLGVPASLIAFCGGHTINAAGTSCRTDPETGPTQAEVIDGATLAWLDRYVKRLRAETGPAVRYQLQNGEFVSGSSIPSPLLEIDGEGSVRHAAVPTSGAVTAPQPSPDAVRIPISEVGRGRIVWGIPRVQVSVTGAGTDASLFFKLLDIDAGGKAVVVDDQVAAIRLSNLSGAAQTATVDLGGVAWRVEDGHSLALEVSTSSNDHTASRVPFIASFTASLRLPVITAPRVLAGRSVRRAAPALPATGIGVVPWVAWLLAGAGIAGAAAAVRSSQSRRP